MTISHRELCNRTANWLRRVQEAVAIVEMHLQTEIIDVLAYHLYWEKDNRLVVPVNYEIKVSRQDYFRDAEKQHIKNDKSFTKNKYYVVPYGMVDEEEFYASAGMIFYRGERFYIKTRIVLDSETAPYHYYPLFKVLLRAQGKIVVGEPRDNWYDLFAHYNINYEPDNWFDCPEFLGLEECETEKEQEWKKNHSQRTIWQKPLI